MGMKQEKIESIINKLKQQDIDIWMIVGQESATSNDPLLQAICDEDFIGMTGLFFHQDGIKNVICTPIDQNGWKHQNLFNEVEAFNVSFEKSLIAYFEKYQPKRIALNYSLEDSQFDGLSYSMYQLIKRAIDSAKINCEIVSSICLKEAI